MKTGTFRRSGAVLASWVVTLAAGLTPAYATPSLGAAETGVPQIRWEECPFLVENPEAECGSLDVPMDYQDPDGKQISVGFMRIPASSGTPQGSIFVNPGGPSGDVYSAYGTDAIEFTAGIADDYDIVAVQPRGLWKSTPLVCYDFDDISVILRSIAEPGGTNRDACGEAFPGYPAQVTTENTARDWEEVRRALGLDRINIIGVSYGTYLGSVYASLFPEQTDKLVLDSGYSPATMWADLMAAQKGGYERALHDFMRWAADNDDIYHLGNTPLAVYQTWSDKVVEESGTNPTVVPPAAEIGDVPPGFEWAGQTAADLMTATGQRRVQLEGLSSQAMHPGANQAQSPTLVMTRLMLPSPKSWDGLARLVAGEGDMPSDEELQQQAEQFTQRELETLIRMQQSTATMQNIMVCNESPAPTHPERLPEYLWNNWVVGDIFASAPAAFASGAYCQGAEPRTTLVELDGSKLEHRPLQFQATGDPQTVYDNFDEMAEKMNSHVVTVNGSGHGQVGLGNPIADQLVADYLRTGEVSTTEIDGINPSDFR